MLYFRMILIMFVSLYTTRVVLRVLGVENFGVYNVVAGVVTMMGFMSSSMSSSVQRFLAIELGRNDMSQLSRVYSMSVNIQVLIALVGLLLAETLGLWFFKTQLMIPPETTKAAGVVYQFSILTLVATVICVPYNAVILAHEKMSIYAFMSILESLLKLLVVCILDFFDCDKLILYAVLIFMVSIILTFAYSLYVRIAIRNCRYQLFWDAKLFKTLINFAAWNLWGNIAVLTYSQGVNVLLNIFFGPIVNAARAVSFQIKGALNSLINNFQVALKPQIIKSYAANEKVYMHNLIFTGSKYSYFLMLLLCMPFILNAPLIIELWLGHVPEYVVVFSRLVLIDALINSFSGSLMSGAQASGRIEKYQSVVGGLLLLILPVSWFFLHFGFPPEAPFLVSILVNMVALSARVLLVSKLIDFSVGQFIHHVMLPALAVSALVALTLLLIVAYWYDSFIQVIWSNIFLMVVGIGAVIIFGMKSSERRIAYRYIMKRAFGSGQY